ncbi:MAG: ATP-binding protein [Acidobacteriota bacterium]
MENPHSALKKNAVSATSNHRNSSWVKGLVSHRSFSLSSKLAACLIGSLTSIFILLGYMTIRLHKQHLEELVITSAERISDTIKRSSHYSMLHNHRDELYQIISTIGTEPGIKRIRIFNEEGKISFSTDRAEVNQIVDKRAEACYGCHAREQPLVRLNRPDRIRIYQGEGERIMGLINPIENEPSCYNADCHAHPPSQKVLGVLDVSLSLAKVDASIRQGEQQMRASFLLAVSLIAGIAAVLIYLMIYRPIRQLTAGTHRVAAGDLDYKIAIDSRDEIGELASSFNGMTQELKRANSEITQWAKTLETRVEEKTRQLEQAHEHMVQVERIASVGRLAAIVAHEINNPLAGILTYSKLMLKKIQQNRLTLDGPESARQHLEVIASESARCGEIVKNLLQFSRHSKVDLKSHEVNELIRQSLRLVQHKLDLMSVECRPGLSADLPPLVCDGQLIQQALVALFINACEAMTSGQGLLEVDSRYRSTEAMVEIRIRDNGSGMDRDTLKHIFEPFFTTKSDGKGVGLGLAVVYGIVSQHGGQIDVDSKPGQGTCFTILLPEVPPQSLEEGAAGMTAVAAADAGQ